MKAIIKRNLSLNTKYFLIDKKYIPLVNSTGCTCDNCNKLISNIATVKDSEGNIFNIGFDCLETLLINNNLISENDIVSYEKVKSMIPKIIRFSKSIKDVINNNKYVITGIKFEKQTYKSDYYTFYWLFNNQTESRYNDNVKIKDMDYNFLIESIKNIFPKLVIIY